VPILLRYQEIRKPLGMVAAVIMIIAYLSGFAVPSILTAEQESSLFYTVGVFSLVFWAYASGIAKMLMIGVLPSYKSLNVAALLLFAISFVFSLLSPSVPVETSSSQTVYSVLTHAWVISWVALDICEIFLLKKIDERSVK